MELILNVELNEVPWNQSSLPVKLGGLGIRRATDLATPAFLASAHGTEQGVQKLLPQDIANNVYEDLQEAKSLWEELLNNNDAVQPKNPTVQAEWDSPIYKAKYESMLNEEECPIEQARLRAVAAEHASDWLNALPIPT